MTAAKTVAVHMAMRLLPRTSSQNIKVSEEFSEISFKVCQMLIDRLIPSIALKINTTNSTMTEGRPLILVLKGLKLAT